MREYARHSMSLPVAMYECVWDDCIWGGIFDICDIVWVALQMCTTLHELHRNTRLLNCSCGIFWITHQQNNLEALDTYSHPHNNSMRQGTHVVPCLWQVQFDSDLHQKYSSPKNDEVCFYTKKLRLIFFGVDPNTPKKPRFDHKTQLVTFALPHTRSDSIHTQAQDKCEKHDKNKGATTSTEQNYFSLTRAPARHDLIHSWVYNFQNSPDVTLHTPSTTYAYVVSHWYVKRAGRVSLWRERERDTHTHAHTCLDMCIMYLTLIYVVINKQPLISMLQALTHPVSMKWVGQVCSLQPAVRQDLYVVDS